MKKRIMVAILLVCLCIVPACGKKEKEEKKESVNKEAIKFKEAYENLNGKKNTSGVEYRTVSIKEDNPYVEVSAEDIVKKIEDKETFYVYFGDEMCPWCRSAIEKSIEVANKKGIKTIYYVSIWDEEHNEILRDKYELNKKGKAKKTQDGTETYYKLLKSFDSVLSDYKLTNDKGKKVSTGEKRIFAPNYIYVEKGVAKKLIEGTSDKQKDANEKLTDEMLKDEEKIFTDFFSNK